MLMHTGWNGKPSNFYQMTKKICSKVSSRRAKERKKISSIEKKNVIQFCTLKKNNRINLLEISNLLRLKAEIAV